ncbi:hypothetical protein LCGC14_2373220, partial [marine sediment metagenome]
ELSDAQKLRIYEIQTKTVKDQGARLSAAETELAELRAAKEEAAKPTVEDSAKAFYANPAQMIKDALAEAIAPLNVFKDRFEGDAELQKVKKGLMVNPVFAQHLANPEFSSIIDELVAEGTKQGAKVSEGMVEAAIKHTIGSIVTGDVVLSPVKGSETTVEVGKETGREDTFIPPYLAPSSPPHKKTVEGKQYRDLTENEERLRKERNMSKEDYLNWLEVDAADVIDSKIGIPAKKAGDK